MGGIELIVDVFCHVSLPALKQWSLYALSNAMQNSSKFQFDFLQWVDIVLLVIQGFCRGYISFYFILF